MTHVAEIRLTLRNEATRDLYAAYLQQWSAMFSSDPIEVKVRAVDESPLVSWNSPVPPPATEKPSDKQLWFFRKLRAEILHVTRDVPKQRFSDHEIFVQARQLIQDVDAAMEDPANQTKTGISDVINALKEAQTDIDWLRTGRFNAPD